MGGGASVWKSGCVRNSALTRPLLLVLRRLASRSSWEISAGVSRMLMVVTRCLGWSLGVLMTQQSNSLLVGLLGKGQSRGPKGRRSRTLQRPGRETGP